MDPPASSGRGRGRGSGSGTPKPTKPSGKDALKVKSEHALSPVAAPASANEPALSASDKEALGMFLECRGKILKEVPALMQDTPDGITAGATLNLENLLKKISEGEDYDCNVNLTCLSMMSPTPELPLLQKKVKALAASRYSKPKRVKPLTVAVDEHCDRATLVKQITECALPVASPIEHVHAFWYAWAQVLDQISDEENVQWVRAAVSVQVTFKVLPGDERRWFAMNEREDLQDEYQALRNTTLMRILSFACFRQKYEAQNPSSKKPDPAELAKAYTANCRVGAGSTDKVSKSFVDMAQTFMTRMWCIPQAGI